MPMDFMKKTPPKRPGIERSAALKRFGRYKDEAEAASRRAGLKMGKALESILDAWEASKTAFQGHDMMRDRTEAAYESILDSVEGRRYTGNDIQEFVVSLNGLLGEEGRVARSRAGLFISALVNAGDGHSYSIDLSGLPPQHHLGYRNVKNLVINGDVGDWFGMHMGCGRAEVNGNVGYEAANSMEGGEIIIHGNAGNYLGGCMRGGLVIVDGDALVVGYTPTMNPGQRFQPYADPGRMTSGSIYVRGRIEACYGLGASVYAGGKRVVGYNPPLGLYY
jgi:hypothetical protein